ncbi:hypothetical protein CON36_35435 [Bacillus cereus]|uniref:PrgI family protein n=2 Tax=Bacillus cereus group TaxID=86661 RepID=A0A9X6XUU6_BACCE|nr:MULTISPECIES: hypothetical protein [Bacillus cereus group]PDZ94127.1 hypothetical protein CON36_35435 [Bacillus cereus]PFJ30982.1 hypothetical protein COJ15_30065 [Bacillus thuringiensis]PGP12786.1 hypothetical protein COA01_33760 [Bacillus cereus]
MHHVIPQQFNQSDKIGRFTISQIVILGAVAIIYILIVMSSNFWISIIALFPLSILAFVLMYFRVNKIPIYEFLFIYLIYMGSPKLLVYRSDNLKSIEEKEEGIGFIDVEKTTTNKSNKNSETKKNAPDSKVKSKKSQKKPVTAPRPNEKAPTRNQTQTKRVTQKVQKNKGVKK